MNVKCPTCGRPAARDAVRIWCETCGPEKDCGLTQTENCPTCGGCGWIVIDQTFGWPYGEQVQCPDCWTPENVETSSG